MPFSIGIPQFNFIQSKEKELLIIRRNWAARLGTVLKLHVQGDNVLLIQLIAAAFVACFSNINNYKQSSATGIWNKPYIVTASDVKVHFSSHHWFSLHTWASPSSVKSFLTLNVFRISSVFPLIILASLAGNIKQTFDV